MDDTSTTTANLDQADQDILAYDVSDEALEDAAGTEGMGVKASIGTCRYTNFGCC